MDDQPHGRLLRDEEGRRNGRTSRPTTKSTKPLDTPLLQMGEGEVSAITGRTRLRKLGQPHGLSSRSPGARLRFEASSARGLAAWARPLRGQVPGGQPVPVAADQELTTVVAAGAIGLGIVDV